MGTGTVQQALIPHFLFPFMCIGELRLKSVITASNFVLRGVIPGKDLGNEAEAV